MPTLQKQSVTFAEQAFRNAEALKLMITTIGEMAQLLVMPYEAGAVLDHIIEKEQIDEMQPSSQMVDLNMHTHDPDVYLDVQTRLVSMMVRYFGCTGQLPANLQGREADFDVNQLEIAPYDRYEYRRLAAAARGKDRRGVERECAMFDAVNTIHNIVAHADNKPSLMQAYFTQTPFL